MQHAGSGSTVPTQHKLTDWRNRLRACAGSRRSSFSRRHNTTIAAAAASPADAAAALPSVGQAVEVSCQRVGTGGVGICLWGSSGFTLLVRGALPGERLTAAIDAVKKNYAEGRKLSTLAPHTDAAAPACQHFGACGGCSLQALAYPAQLAHKQEYVAQTLSRVGKLDGADVAAAQQPAVGAEAVYGYRNKLQLAFSSLVWQQQADATSSSAPAATHQQQGFGLGYFVPGSNSVVLPVQECALASPEMNEVVTQVCQLCQQHGLQPHNSPDGRGVLRHLIVRSAAGAAAVGVPPAAAAAAAAGQQAGRQQLMAVLVTSAAISNQPAAKQALSRVAQQLVAACPGLVGVVHSIEAAPTGSNSSSSRRGSSSSKGVAASGKQPSRGRPPAAAAARGSGRGGGPQGGGELSQRGAQPLRVQSSRVLAGVGSLVESLCGLQFQVSPHSFFQTHTAQAQRLYELVVQAAAEAAVGADGGGEGGLVLDLFCGTGTIALCLAAAMPTQRVVGIDVSASAIADAQANAARNGLDSNVSFVCGDLNQLLAEQQGKQQQPQLQGVDSLSTPRVVVVDPARAGLGPGVVDYLRQCGAQRVVYVSCNAATQARDLQQLCGGGSAFRLVSWRCVDLFPQTDVAHVETVVVLDRLLPQVV